MNMHTRLALCGLLATITGSGCLIRPLDHEQAAPPQPAGSMQAGAVAVGGAHYKSSWPATGQHDWIGSDVWPDLAGGWKLEEGAAVCYGRQSAALRCLTLGSHALTAGAGRFTMSVDITITPGDSDGYAGFLLGRPSPYPSPGSQTGKLARIVFAGISTRGDALVAANPSHERLSNWMAQSTNTAAFPSSVRLQLHGLAIGDSYALVLSCSDPETGVELVRSSLWDVPPQLVRGFPSLSTGPVPPGQAGRCRFRNLELRGEKVTTHALQAGPILGAWHTITAATLKMRVQLVPLGEHTPPRLSLELADGTNWTEAATAPVDQATGSALLEVADWVERPATGYRVRATVGRGGETTETGIWHGSIARDPRGGELAVAILPAPSNDHVGPWQLPPYGVKTASPYDPRLAPALAAGCRAILTPATPMAEPTPANLQARYLWSIAYAAAGRTTAFPSAISSRSAYGGLGIVPFAGTNAPSATGDWEVWIGADVILPWSRTTLDETAGRLAAVNATAKRRRKRIEPPPVAAPGTTFDLVGIIPKKKMLVLDRLLCPAGTAGEAHRQNETRRSPGWPLGVPVDPTQDLKPVGYLPPVQVTGFNRPVVQLIEEATSNTVQVIRLDGQVYLPRVYTDGTYTIHVVAPELGESQTLTGQSITRLGEAETTLITF
jgi:hypothetical protein